MFRVATVFTVAFLLSQVPSYTSGVFEREVTTLLQDKLKDHHPYTIPTIPALNASTYFISLLFSANNTILTGFDKAYITKFVPPLPLISDAVKIEGMIENMHFYTEDYSLHGMYRGYHMSASGRADLTMEKFTIKVFFRAAKYTLLPMSFCIKTNSLVLKLDVDSITCNLQGAPLVSAIISANEGTFMHLAEERVNENTRAMEAAINSVTCRT
ncbi:uncharacterized protein [Cherax quadricarinatus]|uniref:uncharacterized protein n=1 Tax=Cherax quadricarinatus TaxID=27406 RepID=UPI002379D8B3|nr:uncharacterized protein LOC128697845 [Cherax quadricarinatus]